MADTTTTTSSVPAAVAPAVAPAVEPAVVAEPASAAEAPPAAASADPAASAPTGTAPTDTPAPTATSTAAVDTPTVVVAHWPALPASHPLLAFHARLPTILKEAGHDRIWGVTLSPTPEFGTFVVLQKFLRSTAGDLEAAAKNLGKTLVWRREFGLDKEGEEEGYVSSWEKGEQFEGLGYVTEVSKGKRGVVTWNVYGAVKDMKATFGDVDRFLQWRVALMERALRRLHLATTTTPVPDYGAGDDPHRLAQVHVYTGVSFLRMDPHVKAASKAVIELMGAHYPETLSRKMFVGVPLLMSWVFTAVRVFVSADTAKKFVVVSYPSNLAPELSDDKGDLPEVYGGTGPGLAELEQRAEKA